MGATEGELKKYATDMPDNTRDRLIAALTNLEKSEALSEETPTKTSVTTADNSEEEEEEDDEEDDADGDDPAPPPSTYMKKGPRASVSAEAYGQWNQLKAFTPPVHEKNVAQKTKLVALLQKSFLFNALDEENINVVVDAMLEAKIENGTRILQEGDDGDVMYIIEVGTFDCLKKLSGEEKVVKTCGAGDFFGELALLYSCPRAASVVATTDGLVWHLDRDTFNHIVRESAMRKHEGYEGYTPPNGVA